MFDINEFAVLMRNQKCDFKNWILLFQKLDSVDFKTLVVSLLKK